MSNNITESTEKSLMLTDLATRIKGLIQHWLKNWYWLLAMVFLGGLGGVVLAWLQPNQYTAKSSFAIDEKNSGMGGALGLAAEFGFNVGGSGRDVFSGENIIYIIHSKRIIREVLLTVDSSVQGKPTLADEFWQDYFASAKQRDVKFSGSTSSFSYKQDSLLSEMYEVITSKLLTVGKPDKKYNVYELTFTSRNERFSKVFCERLLDAASKYYTALRTKRSKQNLEVLETRAMAIRGKASTAIQSQAAEKDANVNPVFAKAAAQATEKQLDLTAYGKAYEELFRNMELARYQYLNDIPFIQVIDPPAFPIKNKKMGRFKAGIIGGVILCLASLFAMALAQQMISKPSRKV